jgi:hypothetical protein
MKTYKQFLVEASDEYLYHATYTIHKQSVAKNGLKKNSDHNNWDDSKKGRLYLAKNPHVALSYAESSDEVSDEHYDSGIIVYKVHKKHLDNSKIKKDSNVRNSDRDTVEYHDDIPFKYLKIHSKHDT